MKYYINFLFFFSMFLCSNVYGQPKTSSIEAQELQTLGTRMYHEGVLPSGKPMFGIIKGDLPAIGTSFACVSCHMLSGLGSIEGSVLTTPTDGRSLFTQRTHLPALRPGMGSMGSTTGKSTVPPQYPPPRPAYSNESLAAVLRGGLDSSGRVLDPVMPRYNLQDSEMKILISYLKSLSSEYSPGIDGKNMRFATVITDDVPKDLQEEQFILLDKLIHQLNEQADIFEQRLNDPKLGRHLSKTGRMVFRKLSLSRWTLKGPPESWQTQLEEYYQKEPVFALLGGITSGSWKPIHDFSESNRIPCLFPQTDFPVISNTNNYTFYLSKGYYQEGESAARFLNRNLASTSKLPIVQIVRDSPEGQALSAGFTETWHELGYPPPITIQLKPGEPITNVTINKQLATEPITLLIWDGPDSMALFASLEDGKIKPAAIFVSSGYLGKKTTTLPDNFRENTYITYPHRLPLEEEKLESFFFGSKIKNMIENDHTIRTMKRSYPINRMLIQVLSEMKEKFYRDYLLDLISMSKDLQVPLYERLSFGPGQRYASKGCYIVQLSAGDTPTFIKRSDWVIH